MVKNKKFVEITSNGQKIKINRRGLIGHGNPINSGEAPDRAKLAHLREFLDNIFFLSDDVNTSLPSNILRYTYKYATGKDVQRGDFIYAMHLEGYNIYPVNEGSSFCYFNYDEIDFWLQLEYHYPKLAKTFRSAHGKKYKVVALN